jgi:Lrp/AsnC family transcriptional regulator, regulator for asnA, asnC and gidA
MSIETPLLGVDSVPGLDDVDRGLIEALLEDGRMSFRAMGARVGLAGDAVRERYRRLVEQGIVQVIGVPDVRTLGYHAAAVVGISVSGKVKAVAEHLAKIPDISLVTSSIGTFDIIVEVVGRDEEHLADLIDEHVRMISSVSECTTLLFLDVIKWSPAHTAGPNASSETAISAFKADSDDRNIMLALQTDGRASYSALAEELGTSYQLARRRTMQLIASGAVKITTSVNRMSVGRATMAAVCIRVAGRPLTEVADDLVAMREVEVVVQTLGRFDLLVEVACRNRAHLRSVIIDGIRNIPGIVSTDTVVYTRFQKIPVQWGAATLRQALDSI